MLRESVTFRQARSLTFQRTNSCGRGPERSLRTLSVARVGSWTPFTPFTARIRSAFTRGALLLLPGDTIFRISTQGNTLLSTRLSPPISPRYPRRSTSSSLGRRTVSNSRKPRRVKRPKFTRPGDGTENTPGAPKDTSLITEPQGIGDLSFLSVLFPSVARRKSGATIMSVASVRIISLHSCRGVVACAYPSPHGGGVRQT